MEPGPTPNEPVGAGSGDKTKQKKKTAPRGSGKSRQPGRPHKRLQNDVLQARAVVLSKKLQVLQAKKTLLAERLEAYTLETQLREQESASDPV